MSRDEGTDWSWVVILAGLLGSLLGVLYSFRFLFSALVMFALYLLMTPRSRKIDRGWEALAQVYDWEEGKIPRPPEEVFERAADWFMHEWVHDYRQEDMQTDKQYGVPEEVRRYLKSSRELPYRNGGFL